jgi:hypothetical protein
MEALRALDGKGLAPTSLALREPSLDDVFLALTGRHAEPGNAGNGNQSHDHDKERGAA